MSEVVFKPKAALAGSRVSTSEDNADGTLLYDLDKMGPARSTLFNSDALRVAVERQLGGGTPPRSVASYWKGSIPWASVKDFTDDQTEIASTQESISTAGLRASASNLIPAGIPLVCTRMAVGRAALAIVPMAINQDVKALFPAAGVDPRHLLRLLHYAKPKAEAASVGSTVKGIRVQDYLSLVVPQAPSDEQPIIARILDTLDTAIRQTEAIIAKLKQVKQGLLHDLLTRGVDANDELRPPQSQAPHLYKQSPLGWIPKVWSVIPTSSLCALITKGTTPAANEMWQGEGGIRFLRVDNLSFDGQLNFDASKFRVSHATHCNALARSRCFPGDVLTNIVGPPLGKLGLVNVETGEVNINQAVALFRPTEALLPQFLLLWLSSSISQVWLRQRAKQTSGQVNLTLALCQELPLPNMELAEQQAIVDRIDAVQDRICLEAGELAKLSKLKLGLMDDLLTGRVRVTPLLDATATL